LEDRLVKSGLGFKLWNKVIPGLFFADDIVLFSETIEDLEGLLEITDSFAGEFKLQFSSGKSKFSVLNGIIDKKTIKMGCLEIDRVEKYVYLGVTIGSGLNYLEEHEKMLLKKLGKYLGIIKNRSYLSYNKYEVTRILWKGVAVPGLTYANDVLVLDPKVREILDRGQNQIGRFALGVSGHTANEAVQGEMGWSSFEAREAQAKLQYFGRMLDMEDCRLAKIVYKFNSRWASRVENTKWFRRTRFLEKRYLEGEKRLDGIEGAPKGWRLTFKNCIQKNAIKTWKKGMAIKSSLQEAYFRKEAYRRESYIDNRRGSCLLVQARTGSLLTRVRKAKFMELTGECIFCVGVPESIQHIIVECKGLAEFREDWEWPQGTENWADCDKFGLRLGFEVNDLMVDFKELEKTKRLLLKWEFLTKSSN
jgi:hypothetical protein